MPIYGVYVWRQVKQYQYVLVQAENEKDVKFRLGEVYEKFVSSTGDTRSVSENWVTDPMSAEGLTQEHVFDCKTDYEEREDTDCIDVSLS